MVLLAVFRPHLMTTGGEKRDGSILAIPRGIVIFIGMVAFVSFLVEGAVMDWGGMFLTSVKHRATCSTTSRRLHDSTTNQ